MIRIRCTAVAASLLALAAMSPVLSAGATESTPEASAAPISGEPVKEVTCQLRSREAMQAALVAMALQAARPDWRWSDAAD